MSITQLHDSWWKKVQQFWSDKQVTQQRMMTWMLVGLFRAGSVQLSKIAEDTPSQAKLTSTTRRIERFVDNAHIRVRGWYYPVIKPVIGHIAYTTMGVDSGLVRQREGMARVARRGIRPL